ncbi:hypothetical protein C8R45DRAFT_419218 [Mycena sanguinolenta]|nr:hypothetical protein C8R45DRAFT_419218 [Mycena sanguinolenta]
MFHARPDARLHPAPRPTPSGYDFDPAHASIADERLHACDDSDIHLEAQYSYLAHLEGCRCLSTLLTSTSRWSSCERTHIRPPSAPRARPPTDIVLFCLPSQAASPSRCSIRLTETKCGYLVGCSRPRIVPPIPVYSIPISIPLLACDGSDIHFEACMDRDGCPCRSPSRSFTLLWIDFSAAQEVEDLKPARVSERGGQGRGR